MSYAVIWFLKRLITIYIIIFRRLLRQVEVLRPIMNWMWTETLHYYENRIFPLDEEYVLIMCRDISERVATQQNLEIFKRILDRVSDSILAVSADGTLVYANRQFIEEYGVKEELGTQKVYDLPVSLEYQRTYLINVFKRFVIMEVILLIVPNIPVWEKQNFVFIRFRPL